MVKTFYVRRKGLLGKTYELVVGELLDNKHELRDVGLLGNLLMLGRTGLLVSWFKLGRRRDWLVFSADVLLFNNRGLRLVSINLHPI